MGILVFSLPGCVTMKRIVPCHRAQFPITTRLTPDQAAELARACLSAHGLPRYDYGIYDAAILIENDGLVWTIHVGPHLDVNGYMVMPREGYKIVRVNDQTGRATVYPFEGGDMHYLNRVNP